jgi:hypothetical protein
MLGIASTATALAHGAALRPHRAHIAAVHPKPAATLTAKLDRALNCPTVQYDRVRVTRLEQAYRCGLSKPARGQLLRVYDQAIPVLDATSGTRGLSSPRLPSHDIDRPKAWRRSASQLPASTNQQSSELTWPQKLAWRITLCCPKPVFGTKYVDTSPCYWQAREVPPNSLAPRRPAPIGASSRSLHRSRRPAGRVPASARSGQSAGLDTTAEHGITRQARPRYVDPDGQLRPEGEKLLRRSGSGAEPGQDEA